MSASHPSQPSTKPIGHASVDLALPFMPRTVPADLPQHVVALMRELVIHEHTFRTRILEAPPLSRQRGKLMREMYAGTWALIDQIEQQMGEQAKYQSGFRDRSMHARSINRLVRPGRCLEVGCGGGALCRALAVHGWEVLGVDVVTAPDWDKITSETNDRARFLPLEFTTQHTEIPGPFDLVVMDECLEHFPPGEYETALLISNNKLRPGGWLVVIIPNPLTGPHDCSINFRPRGAPAIGGHFNEKTITALAHDLRAAGFHNFQTVISYGIHSGVKYGWSRWWFYKAVLSEWIFRLLPQTLWSDQVFELFVPYVLAAQKT